MSHSMLPTHSTDAVHVVFRDGCDATAQRLGRSLALPAGDDGASRVGAAPLSHRRRQGD